MTRAHHKRASLDSAIDGSTEDEGLGPQTPEPYTRLAAPQEQLNFVRGKLPSELALVKRSHHSNRGMQTSSNAPS
eukprot:CAMPEP_0204115518 /NCGR_PEP_ID=MMETSP0361-20130328/4871_1 /ASSEMBLY_ACC=CAM_ASM_000343 /TAXON_ID=268821 /ORGANISM="Scrippsiella Hangoei, Strain SHTV-5" /LENGTH=74 /DNA_ID=CAMNT_0051066181 /DNA_START=68 /DNA_END=290 /DNA_ORIENTATION=+